MEIEHIDRSALIRKWTLEKIEDYFMRIYGEAYRKGKCSLEEASNKAEVSVWKMIDYIRRESLWPKDSLENALKEPEHAKKLQIEF